ncbi:MAG TPA: spore coat protein CotJB [Tenericutes bacterium]|nr:spore coat protein CotJB [Mycoplasmatota bacterium]
MNKAEYELYSNERKDESYGMSETCCDTFNTLYNKMYHKENEDYMLSTLKGEDNYMFDDAKDMALFSVNEGFEKGNMFKNLYEQYKNYKPKDLKPKNEKEETLLAIDELAFAMHEINLYLNVYPDDMMMINKYNQLQREYNQILKYYESKFGPIQTNNEHMTKSPFAWTEDTWPWDRRDF